MSDTKATDRKVHSISQVHCSTCSLSSLCLPVSLNLTEMDRLDNIIEKSRPLKKVNTCSIRAIRFHQFMQSVPAALRATA